LMRAILNNDDADSLFEIDADEKDEAVYFDLFGQWIFWWPSRWSILLTALAGSLFAATCSILKKRQRNPNRKPDQNPNRESHLASHSALNVLKGLGGIVLTIVVVVLVLHLLQMAVRLDDRLANPWPANPAIMLAGYWLASFAVVGAISSSLLKSLGGESAWVAFGIFWLVLALACSAYVTGASHLFIVPILTATLFAVVGVFCGRDGIVSILVVAAIAVGVLWLPLERLFYDAVGFRMPYVMCGRMAVVSSVLLSLLSVVDLRSRFWFAISACVGSTGCFAAALLLS